MKDNFRLAYELDGMVRIVVPSPKFMGTMEELIKTSVPKGVEHYHLHVSEIPSDRYFRNALEIQNKKIGFNMKKCKAVHVDHLRVKRADLFKALDIEGTMALEAKNEAKLAVVVDKKQKLRDMPLDPIFNSATTPEELKAIVPEYMEK